MVLLKQSLNKKKILGLFIMSLIISCQQKGHIIIKLPNSFKGYGALIFDGKNDCRENQKDIVVFPNNQGFVFVPNNECVIMNNIDRRYKFEMLDSIGIYRKICPTSPFQSCDSSQCDTYDGLFHNGGSLLSMNSKKIVIFHIGHCDDPDSLLYLNSKESIRFREMLDSLTLSN